MSCPWQFNLFTPKGILSTPHFHIIELWENGGWGLPISEPKWIYNSWECYQGHVMYTHSGNICLMFIRQLRLRKCFWRFTNCTIAMEEHQESSSYSFLCHVFQGTCYFWSDGMGYLWEELNCLIQDIGKEVNLMTSLISCTLGWNSGIDFHPLSSNIAHCSLTNNASFKCKPSSNVV